MRAWEPAAPTLTPPLQTPPTRMGRGRRGLLVGVALAVVVLLAGGIAAFALLGSGGGDQQGFVSACPGAGHPAACITSIAFDGNDLAVQFTTHDLDSVRNVFQGGQVGTVFFLASIHESQAGSVIGNGRTDAWLPWSTESPFAGANAAGQHGFTAGTVGDVATAVCVLLGDANGRVLTNTGNCAELPPKP